MPYVYDGSSDTATASAAWISAAQSHFNGIDRHLETGIIDFEETLKYLFFERCLEELLRQRDPGLPNLPISLSAFRDTIPPLPADDPDRPR